MTSMPTCDSSPIPFLKARELSGQNKLGSMPGATSRCNRCKRLTKEFTGEKIEDLSAVSGVKLVSATKLRIFFEIAFDFRNKKSFSSLNQFFYLTLQKIDCTRQFENKFSLRSFVQSLQKINQ